MLEPLYLGQNELGIPVYEIREGDMRPMVDKDGKIVCKNCSSRAVPLRVSLAPGRIGDKSGVEWVLLCCPSCHAHQVHCMMRVKLMRRQASDDVPKLTKLTNEQIDGMIEKVMNG